VRGVVVGAGVTNVEVSPSAGSSLRLRVRARAGEEPPWIYAVAEPVDEPRIWRRVDASIKDQPIVLPGLGPGTYRLRADPRYSAVLFDERQIVVDGVHDPDIELERR
jgi:hypothetical protein